MISKIGHDNIILRNVFNLEEKPLKISDIISIKKKNSDIIISIPHSGMLVPIEFLDLFNLDQESLLEIDMFSDLPFQINKGIEIKSNLAPFFVDMNRSREGSEDKDTPFHLQNDPLHYFTVKNKMMLKKDYSDKEKKEIISYYDHYHEMLDNLIRSMKEKKGYALVIDAHSMTSVGLGRAYDKDKERADLVVGTLEDSSAHPKIISSFVDSLRSNKHGFSVMKNKPYSGGFITRKHNDPNNDVHVIQLEVKMKKYMFEGFDQDNSKRYLLKEEGLRNIKETIISAIDNACKEAERIYSDEAP